MVSVRVKLAVIGDPGASKTEVVATLQSDDSGGTKDDNLFTVQVEDVIFHAWNFPLQRSEHTAHQFVPILFYRVLIAPFSEDLLVVVPYGQGCLPVVLQDGG